MSKTYIIRANGPYRRLRDVGFIVWLRWLKWEIFTLAWYNIGARDPEEAIRIIEEQVGTALVYSKPKETHDPKLQLECGEIKSHTRPSRRFI